MTVETLVETLVHVVLAGKVGVESVLGQAEARLYAQVDVADGAACTTRIRRLAQHA